MKRTLILALSAAVMLAACAQAPTPAPGGNGAGVGYYYDPIRKVHCWTHGSGAGGYTASISCLPDSQVAH